MRETFRNGYFWKFFKTDAFVIPNRYGTLLMPQALMDAPPPLPPCFRIPAIEGFEWLLNQRNRRITEPELGDGFLR
ncbi:hypothetical protein D3C86_2030320 [compost metagenome]